MAIPEKAKPATAIAVNGPRNSEQLGGRLDSKDNKTSQDNRAPPINLEALRLDVHAAIATAKIAEFENQSYRLGNIIATGILGRAAAADLLLNAAIGNNLVAEHGDDFIQTIMAEGLSGAAP